MTYNYDTDPEDYLGNPTLSHDEKTTNRTPTNTRPMFFSLLDSSINTKSI